MTIAPGTVLASRYRADALLGRGGMGEVWRCHDLEQGRNVAVKAVRKDMLADSGAAKLFHSEVVAVARLSHPGIIPVYDALQDARSGALLVMEHRDGKELGVLADEDPPWPVVRDLLAQVLSALAYAHARGVLHLDIKPENILLDRVEGARRATLLDFGIARIRRPGRGIERWFERDAIVGTLEYMASEQCTGAFERLGPWTDLFSVGAVAFELCAGRRPFPGAGDHAGLVRRLREPPPRLVPMLAGVPAGFPDLCAALLAVDPRDRPTSAADVLAELLALDDEGRGLADRAAIEVGGDPALKVSSPTAETRPLDDPEALAPTAVVPTREIPPVSAAPASPRRAAPSTIGAQSAEAAFNAEAEPPPAGAYGLFGLRDLPVLGRHEERRAVWSAVRDAATLSQTRVVLLEGPAGVGKSRIARDAIERAVELGLCFPMHSSWSADGSSDEGLRGLMENLLDSRGAPGQVVSVRLAFWLDRMIADLQRKGGTDPCLPGEHKAFAREVELYLRPPRDAAPDAGLPIRVAMEAIARAARARPVLLWLDDVQWSRGEAGALISALRAREPALPVCVLCTVRTAEVADRGAYEQLAALPGTERVLVDRLDREATRRLVRGLLDVDDALGDFFADRAEGNPLFAGLMLRQLVMADAIVRKDGRYRLSRAYDLSAVPGDVGALFARRVEQSGAGKRELGALAIVRERVSLEVAGELGRRIGPGFDEALGKALRAGLLRVEGHAYVWEHGLLREQIVKGIARDEAPALHEAAAGALAVLIDREDVQEERAHHLRAAGHVREACAALLDAGLWSLRHATPAPRRARFEMLAAWAKEARLIDLEARAHAELGYAQAEIGEAKKAAEIHAAARLLIARGAGEEAAAWVDFRRSQSMRLEGRVDEGARASRDALDHARRARVGEVERLALLQIGMDCCRAKQDAEARRILEEAAALAHDAGDRVAESLALRTLTHISDAKTALSLVERAIELARAAGALRVELTAKQVWVDALWRAGDHEQARREARALGEEAGRRALRQTASLLALQSGAWALLEDDFDEARAQRDTAARWGASKGAIVERMVLLALDLHFALRGGDLVGAAAAVEAMEAAAHRYHEDLFRELLERAAVRAPAPMAARLRAISEPSVA